MMNRIKLADDAKGDPITNTHFSNKTKAIRTGCTTIGTFYVSAAIKRKRWSNGGTRWMPAHRSGEKACCAAQAVCDGTVTVVLCNSLVCTEQPSFGTVR